QSFRQGQPPTATLFPYTTLFRSHHLAVIERGFRAFRLASFAQATSCTSAPLITLHSTARALHPLPRLVFALSGQRFHQAGSNRRDRKSTRLNSSHVSISYAAFRL